ncbi:DUF6114 domain-containing protein [Sphaerisporangium dianthi]|uniref:DUF6114 domain-containing protein n=1 Tax=Sphaerisporangium dianthi TaxID=1436120 RepID=A0ABV9CAD7_9ACTN
MKAWRRSRPFWGGLLTLMAGTELLSIPFSLDALPLIIHSVEAGLAYLLAITMIVLGLLILFQPAQRVFLGVVAILMSIASVVYANVGGFLLGLIMGLLGGALTAAWTPVPETAPPPENGR